MNTLIVGAGPTGLAAALTLASHGASVRIIDKGSARSDKSKALGVQAGTLECLAAVFGTELARTMVSAGQPARAASIHIDAQAPRDISFDSIASAYPFILILEQSETERILEEALNRLGVRVERQTELVALDSGENTVTAEIRLPSGEIARHEASYVIGCDGAHSTVRRLLEIPFAGASYEGEFILADAEIDWEWPYGSVRTFVSPEGALACFPMRGERKYRLILIPKNASPSTSSEISLEELKPEVARLSGERITVKSTTWRTRFRVHHRIVEKLGHGRVFLAGDAAHIHSPAGGQGMNTGIQDAMNLAFKLLAPQAAPGAALAAYERERLPVARAVLRGTDFVFSLALRPETPFMAWARRSILPRVLSTPWITRKVVTAISEIRIARREIARYPK